ncbi:leucine-rich repeat flightless-interacting protein 2 isoform X3 [Phycodurus eques]|uniref:leucine-rich repeat flightless-interacting protein 2 isoform X3 n=1 Tax=Phycodurus eques TaxID=693459 RepID=UPI002ACD46E2|nr:leucine-rich repeat flightless-interacting protein 2 isoform X3 [Phycodurus eques]
MLSVTLDNSGSPKKRTFSRSEDESLRSIIRESESSPRRLTRSDSRPGTLKRRPDSLVKEQSDQDLSMGLPEMLELQASYDEAVHELRGLEVEREALLFQVDVLQDTLEGVEELLAETQREAGQANAELEQERGAKRKLEHLVRSLMQEVETLKEERNSCMHISGHTNESEVDAERRGCQMNDPAKVATQSTFASEATAPSEDVCPAKGDEGSLVTKVKWMTNPAPSFALDDLLHEDGVHRRPYNSGNKGGRDLSPDKSDSDTASTYEDASADTPEQDVPLELPRDSASKDNTDSQEPQNGRNCIVS